MTTITTLLNRIIDASRSHSMKQKGVFSRLLYSLENEIESNKNQNDNENCIVSVSVSVALLRLPFYFKSKVEEEKEEEELVKLVAEEEKSIMDSSAKERDTIMETVATKTKARVDVEHAVIDTCNILLPVLTSILKFFDTTTTALKMVFIYPVTKIIIKTQAHNIL